MAADEKLQLAIEMRIREATNAIRLLGDELGKAIITASKQQGQLNATLQKTAQAFQQMRQSAAASGTALIKGTKQAQATAQKLGEAAKQARTLSKESTKAQKSLSSLAVVSKDLIQAIKQTVREVNKLNTRLAQVGRVGKQAADKTAAGMKDVEKSAAGAAAGSGKLTKNLFDARRAAESLYFTGLHLSMLGAAMGAMAILPIKSVAEFEQAMADTIAVTEGARERLSELVTVAKDLGRETRYMGTQVAEGMQLLGMAGLNVTEILSAIAPTLNLATTESMNLTQAADIATNVVQSMQLEVAELARVVDILALVAVRSNTTIIELGEALSYAAPPAAAAGVALEDLAAMAGILSNNGIKATRAGTGLRGILASLVSPSQQARDALRRLGVEIEINADGSLNLMKALRDLGDAGMTLAEANAIFQRRSAAAALALSRQVDQVEELARASREAAGAAKEMAEIRMDTLIGQLTLLRSAFDSLLHTAIYPLLDTYTQVIRWVTGIVTAVDKLAAAQPLLSATMATLSTFPLILAGLLTALGMVALTAGAVGRTFAAITRLKTEGFFGRVAKAATASSVAMDAAAVSGGRLGRVLIWLKALMLELWAVIMKHKIMFLIAAIGTLVTAITVWLRASDDAIAKQKKIAAEALRTSATIESLRRSYEAQKEGTEAQVRAAEALEEALKKVAESNSELRKEAELAIEAIDEQTGKLLDGGKALDEFQYKVDSIRLDALIDQVALLTQKVQEIPFDTVGKWLDEAFKDVVITGIPETLSEMGDASQEAGETIADTSQRIEQANEKTTKKIQLSQKQLAVTLEALVAEMIRLRRLDADSSEEEAEVVIEALSKKRIATEQFLAAFKAVQAKLKSEREAEAAAEAESYDEAIAKLGGTTEKLKIEYKRRLSAIEEAIKNMREARKTYGKELTETQKQELVGLLKIAVFLRQARDRTEKELIKNIQRLRKIELDQLKREEDKELADIEKRIKTEEITTEEGEIRKLEIRQKYAEEAIKINQKAVQRLLAAGFPSESEVVAQARKAVEAAKRTEKIIEDERLTAETRTANRLKKIWEKYEAELSKRRIALITNELAKARAIYEQDVKEAAKRLEKKQINEEQYIATIVLALQKLLHAEATIADKRAEIEQRLQEIKQDINLRGATTLDDVLEASHAKSMISLQERQRKELRQISDYYDKLIALAANAEEKKRLEAEKTSSIEAARRIHTLEATRLSIEQQLELQEKLWEETKANAEAYGKALDEALLYRVITFTEYMERLLALSDDVTLGLSEGFKKAGREIKSLAEVGFQVGSELPKMFSEGLVDSLLDAAEKTKSLQQALNDLFKSMFRYIAEAILRWLALKAVMGLLGMGTDVFAGAGPSMSPFFHPREGGWIPETMDKFKRFFKTFAGGGPVPLNLGVPGKDSVKALLTPGEYVIRPEAVKAYGVEFFEALNRRLLAVASPVLRPREVTVPKMVPRRGYQTGGEVQSIASAEGATQPSGRESKTELTLINVTDPSELDRYLASSRGQRAFLNIISSRARTIRRILLQGA